MFLRRQDVFTTNNVLAPGTSWNAGNLNGIPKAGDRVVVSLMVTATVPVGQLTTLGFIDTNRHVWVRDAVLQFPTGGNVELSIWSTVAKGSAINNLTASFDRSIDGGVGITVVAASGISRRVGAGAAVDVSFTAQAVWAGGVIDTGASVATTTADHGWKIGVYGDGGSNTTITAGTLDFPYAIAANTPNNGNAEVIVEDADAGPSGSTARATFQSAIADGNQACVIVLVYKIDPNLDSHSILFSDWFQRADAANFGANWDAGYTSLDPIQIVGHAVEPTTAGNDSLETVNATGLPAGFPNDQWAQFTYKVVDVAVNGALPQLVLRATAPALVNCYAFQGPGPSGICHITLQGTSIASATVTASVPGDILRAEAHGANLYLYRNNVLLLTAYDTTYASGRAGIWDFTTGGDQISGNRVGEFISGGFQSPSIPIYCYTSQ